MRSISSYARAFKEGNGVRSVYVPVMDVVYDTISSNFLAANSLLPMWSTPELAGWWTNTKTLFHFFSICANAPVLKTLRNTYLNDQSDYIRSKEIIFLIIQPADAFIEP